MRYMNKNSRAISALLFVCLLAILGLISCKKGSDLSSVAEANVSYALLLDEYTISDYDDSIKVFDANGNIVSVDKNGKFLLTTPGTYSFSKNNDTKKIIVYAKVPDSKFTYDKNIKGCQFIAGDTVVLPKCVVKTSITDYIKYSIDLLKNGNKEASFGSGKNEKYFISESGDYKLVYNVVNVFGLTETDEITFSAIDEKRIVFSTEISDKVNLGESIKYNSYGFYKNNKYLSAIKAETPSGQIITENEIEYNELGKYKLSFSSTIDGAEITENLTVETQIDTSNLFVNALGIDAVKSNAKLNNYCLGSDGKPLNGKGAVEIISPSSGGSIYYSSVINLKNLTKSDSLIEFYINKAAGSVTKMQVSFIDVYNPDISLSVYWMQNPWASGMSYAFVKANNQAYIGKSYGGGGVWSSDFGTENGSNYTARESSCAFDVSFDWAKQSVFLNYGERSILDLKDEENLPASFVWDGFTNGEVYMRIDFLTCLNGSIFVKSVEGKDVDGIDFSEIKDNNAVCVDTSYETLPDAVVGKSYPLPYAVNSKINTNKVALALFFDGTDISSEITNNSFTPDNTGEYKIVYSVYDNYGKPIKKLYTITAVNNAIPIAIDGQFLTEVDAAHYLAAPEYRVSGGHGNIETICDVILDGQKLTADKNGYYIDGGQNLSVRITATDYLLNTKTIEYTVNINKDVQVFSHNDIPEYAFVGDVLTFDVSAYNYLTDKEMSCGIYINNSRVSDKYVVPADVDLLKISFKAIDNLSNISSEVYRVKVIGKELTSIKDYLVCDNDDYQTMTLSSGLVYKLGENSSAYNFTIPYVMSAYDFMFKFGFNGGKCNVGSMQIIFSDSALPDKKVVMYLSGLSSDTANVKINRDVSTYSIVSTNAKYRSNCGNETNANKYKDTDYRIFAVMLSTLKNMLTDAAGVELGPIKTWSDGTAFDGFASGTVNVSFSLNCTGATEFIVANVANQSFSYNLHKDDGLVDNAGPVLAIKNKFDTSIFLGQTYILPKMCSFDVFGGSSSVYLNVKKPDGNYLVENQLLSKSYDFTIEQYGKYTLEIVCSDGINITSRNVIVKVLYDKEPIITVNGKVAETFALLDKLTIPDWTLQPNEAVNTKVYVMIQRPDGQITLLNAGDVITFDEKGGYKLIYRAVDEYYNITRVVFTINVK